VGRGRTEGARRRRILRRNFSKKKKEILEKEGKKDVCGACTV
jgi:hypothetical protein